MSAREEVLVLRASAAALINEVEEPCWGLAQGLLQIAELTVLGSGQPVEYFGKGGGQVYSPELAQFMPTCCPACGEWAGRHEGWCIHAHGGEQPAEQPEPVASKQPLHYFGCCPKCHLPGVLTFIGTDNWMVCERHLIAWWIGSGLFSGWQELTFEQHEANKALIERCERIDPPHCTCSSEQGVPDDPRAIVDDLLAWLDLSGLPPVPPVPPSRRRPGEPGDQIE